MIESILSGIKFIINAAALHKSMAHLLKEKAIQQQRPS
jgi:hypothetical protein